MKPCSSCGAPVPPGARFCPKCGSPVASLVEPDSGPRAVVPPPRTQTGPRASQSSAPWWVVPVVIVGLIVIAWVVMANLPSKDEQRVALREVEPVDRVESPTAPAETATLVELNGDATSTRTALQPPMILQEGTPAVSTTAPYAEPVPPPPVAAVPPLPQSPVFVPAPPPPTAAPAQRTSPPARPQPGPTQPELRPAAPSASPDPPPVSQPALEPGGISEGEAVSSVRRYVTSRSIYRTSSACMSVRSRGVVNDGYTIEVWDSCTASGGSRRLGRWRVDMKTGEIFRQNDAGRYLPP